MWLIYIVEVLFINIFAMNMIVAIIDGTYNDVMDQKEKYVYRNKAQVNLESFELLQYLPWFKTTDEIRSVIITTFVQEDDDTMVEHGGEEEMEALMDKIETEFDKLTHQFKKQKHLDEKLEKTVYDQ